MARGDNEKKEGLRPAQIYRQISNVISLTPEEREEIDRFLVPLQSREFGDNIPWDFDFEKLPIWIIGTVIDYQRRRAKTARFEGNTKLHKVLYFLKHYKFQQLTEFFYSPMYFGPYSQDLTDSMNNSIEKGLIRQISTREPYQYELTKAGKAVFLEIDKKIENWGFAEKGKTLDLLFYLYKQSLVTLGSASKWHFIWSTWGPYMRTFMEDIEGIEELPLSPAEKIQLVVKDMPDERLLELARNTPSTSFYPDRIFTFKGSRVLTNYFIPVNTFKEDEAITSSAAREYCRQIPSKVAKLVILYEGISEIIAERIKGNFRPEIEIYGPVLIYPEDAYIINLSLIGRGPVIILTNTIQTGKSAARLYDDLKSKGINVCKVIAFADRDCGARQLFEHEKGIEFWCYVSKKELIKILKWRFSQWSKRI